MKGSPFHVLAIETRAEQIFGKSGGSASFIMIGPARLE